MWFAVYILSILKSLNEPLIIDFVRSHVERKSYLRPDNILNIPIHSLVIYLPSCPDKRWINIVPIVLLQVVQKGDESTQSYN